MRMKELHNDVTQAYQRKKVLIVAAACGSGRRVVSNSNIKRGDETQRGRVRGVVETLKTGCPRGEKKVAN